MTFVQPTYQSHFDSPPHYLYKFRCWDAADPATTKRIRSILSAQAIWFASPTSFNDPFDCRVPYRYDKMSPKAQYQRLYSLCQKRNPNWTEDQIRDECLLKRQTHPMFSSDPKVQQEGLNRWWELLAKKHGIFSLADGLDNILLWSHYADSHRGYCIEFDIHLLNSWFEELFKSDGHVVQLESVRYQDQMPLIIPTNDEEADYEQFLLLLTTKSSVWSYEREHRYIYLDGANCARHISKDTIKRVILGCEMTPESVDEIASLVTLKLPRTEIWKAKKSATRYELEFEKMG